MAASPAFQFYAADFLAETSLMSAAGAGAHVRMLSHSWRTGAIADSPVTLGRAMGLSAVGDPPFEAVWAEVRPHWFKTRDGWINCDLERGRWERANFVERQRSRGRLGGRPKKNPEVKPNESAGFIPGSENAGNGKPNETSSVFSLQSSDLRSSSLRLAHSDQKLPRASRARTSASPTFEAFWSAYPKHVKREAALKAWGKIDPKEYGAIETALAWQRNQPKWRENSGEFIPHASSWLNDRRWEDEPFHLPAEDDQLERVLAGKGRIQ